MITYHLVVIGSLHSHLTEQCGHCQIPHAENSSTKMLVYCTHTKMNKRYNVFSSLIF